MNIVEPDLVVPQGWERTVYGANQPEYLPLPALRSVDGRVVSRWQPTPEERQRIADGADLYLTLLTGNEPIQPQLLTVGGAPVAPIPVAAVAPAHVTCNRCQAQLPKSEGGGMTAGYYKVRYVPDWRPIDGFPCNEGEDVVCDACMWDDPRYIATWGDNRTGATKG